MRKKIVKIPIYDGKLIMYEVENWDYLNTKYSKGEPLSDRCGGVTFTNYKNGNSEYIVGFKSEPINQVLVHEAVHVCSLLFRDRGIILDVDNDEPQAYFTDWVFEQIEKFFKTK